MTKRTSGALGVVILLAFALRVVYANYASAIDPAQAQGMPIDPRDYDLLARNLVAGLGYSDEQGPTAYRPPGYPLMVAAIYWVAGASQAPVLLLQALAGTVLVSLVFALGRRLFTVETGLLAALGAALHPVFIYTTGWLMSESFYLALLALLVWVQVAAASHWGWRRSGVIGGLLGILSLIKPQSMALLIVVVAQLCARREAGRALAAHAAYVGLIMLAIVLPWTVRNYRDLGDFVLISTSGDFNFYHMLVYGSIGEAYRQKDWTAEPHFGSVESARRYRQLAVEWIASNPAAAASRIGERFVQFWDPVRFSLQAERAAITEHPLVRAGRVLYLCFLVLAGIGVVLSRRRWRQLVPLYGVVLHTLAVCLIFQSNTRFSMPAQWVLLLFASFALVDLGARLMSAVTARTSRHRALSAGYGDGSS